MADSQTYPEHLPFETIALELYQEGETWFFRVPELGITGGGCPNREGAIRHCAQAIDFSLEGVTSHVG
jgi:hypothetical protein